MKFVEVLALLRCAAGHICVSNSRAIHPQDTRQLSPFKALLAGVPTPVTLKDRAKFEMTTWGYISGVRREARTNSKSQNRGTGRKKVGGGGGEKSSISSAGHRRIVKVIS